MEFYGRPRALAKAVQRHFEFALVLTFCIVPLQSATLERLSLDDMIMKSTAIVRGTVAGFRAQAQGPLIYTHYTIQVKETLKGSGQAAVDVVVPGGVANGLRQTFPGTPQLNGGDEFIFFLWTGKSGLNQIIGLTQGLFSISGTATPDATATRPASREVVLDPGTGRQVKDQPLVMSVSDLRSRIATTLKGSSSH